MKYYILIFFLVLTGSALQSQTDSTRIENNILDSLYIQEVENVKGERPKVLHAEPLFIDLIRDMGARKGENEWNIGLGMTDNNRSDTYLALVEYEFAPIDRLGLEVELPFSIYYPVNGNSRDSVPGNKLNSIKLAAQYSFFVSEKMKTSLAIGYIHEFEMVPFRDYKRNEYFEGNLFNPFFIAAKRWGDNFHTMIYTGPYIFKPLHHQNLYTFWQINTNIHYMIDGTRNFIGIEFNKEIDQDGFSMVMRPQIRVGIADNILIGIVTGIPVNKRNERISSFIRLIYEPGHKNK